jgi:hypothetical protein
VPYLFADEVVSPEALYDKSRALIIGIEHYPQGKTVPGAVEEAKQVAQAFRHIGFEDIVELYNKDATGRRVQQALTELFAKKVVRSGRVAVFFASAAKDGKTTKAGEQTLFVQALLMGLSGVTPENSAP